MPTRDKKQEIGKAQALGEARAQGVRLEMVDREEGHAEPERDRLPRRHADDQPADQPGPRRGRDAADRLEADPRLGHGLLDRHVEEIDMGACGDLGHDAAEGRMQVELRPHHVGQHFAAPVGVAAHHRGGRLVAARLDAEHGQGGAVRAFRHALFYTVREEIEGGGETVH